MQLSDPKIEIIVKKYSSNFTNFDKVWNFLKTNSEFIAEITNEIDDAIRLFNYYRRGGKIISDKISLKSSVHLRELLKDDLPTVETLMATIVHPQDKGLLEKVIEEISKFEFIDTLHPVENCAAALLLGSYRSAMLVIYPFLRENDVQIASSLEEMIAVIALNAHKTKLFEAVKPWYKDYEEEGFSKELSDAVQNL